MEKKGIQYAAHAHSVCRPRAWGVRATGLSEHSLLHSSVRAEGTHLAMTTNALADARLFGSHAPGQSALAGARSA